MEEGVGEETALVVGVAHVVAQLGGEGGDYLQDLVLAARRSDVLFELKCYEIKYILFV